MLTEAEGYARTVENVTKVLSRRFGTAIEPSSVRKLTKRQLIRWFREAAKTQCKTVRRTNRVLLEGAVRQWRPTMLLIEDIHADGVEQAAVVSIDFQVAANGRKFGPSWLVVNQLESKAEDNGNGDDECETEEPCSYEYGPGNVWDLTQLTTGGWGDTPESCRCYIESVDCESDLANVDDCEGSC